MREVPDWLAQKLIAGVNALGANFDEAGMGDIGDASAIPRATLYYYFSGKADVLAFLLTTALSDLGERVARAAGSVTGTKASLGAVIEAELQYLEQNPATAQLLLANLGRAGKLPDIAVGIREAVQQPVEEILAAGISNRDLVDHDTDVSASALLGAVSVVGLRAVVLLGGIDVVQTADSLLALFWSGIVRPRRTGSPSSSRNAATAAREDE